MPMIIIEYIALAALALAAGYGIYRLRRRNVSQERNARAEIVAREHALRRQEGRL